MNQLQEEALIGFIGILAQFAASALLVILFLLLRRYARRRKYFIMWGQAWLAGLVALGALVLRFYVLPDFDGLVRDNSDAVVRGLYLLYQFSKLSHLALLLAGTLLFASGRRPRPFLRYALPAVAVYALLSVYMSGDLNQIVVWQSPLAAASMGASSYLLFALPESRRSLGSRATATFFAILAALCVVYFFAFGTAADSAQNSVLDGFMRYKSYLDLVLHMLLGFGMIVMLMEDAKREVDDAHAELAVAHDHLRRAALYDSLTGCLNRRAFTEGVGLDVARAAFGSVVMIDMDNLKTVNDTYGHPGGDQMLQYMVDILRNRLRASDKLYRWGGDEFLLVLPVSKARDVLPRIEKHLAQAPGIPLVEGGPLIRLEVSAGAADYLSAAELESAIPRADAAMYERKHLYRKVERS
jgi:diguanylate cyclase (GGDEF)-like protein